MSLEVGVALALAVVVLSVRSFIRQLVATRRFLAAIRVTRAGPRGSLVFRADVPQAFCAGLLHPRVYLADATLGVLQPEELDADRFMLRVRIDGGQLNLEQLRAVADVSVDFARDTADLTDRQNVQYHWIDVRDVPTIWDRLESVGLSTQEACGDCPRIILGSPVAGVSTDEVRVIATGYLAPLVLDECRCFTDHDPWLTLRGLELVFARNT